MGALGVGLDTCLVHQQGVLSAVTEERDAARGQLTDLEGRVRTVEALVQVETQAAEGLRGVVRRRDADLAQPEEQRQN